MNLCKRIRFQLKQIFAGIFKQFTFREYLKMFCLPINFLTFPTNSFTLPSTVVILVENAWMLFSSNSCKIEENLVKICGHTFSKQQEPKGNEL